MKGIILTALFLSFIIHAAYSQADNTPKDGPAYYFNSFQRYKDTNPDSALYFVKLLAATPTSTALLQNLLHNSFAQVFNKMWVSQATDSISKANLKKRVDIGHSILKAMMADSNQNLVNSAAPIYYWTQIQQNENNTQKLIALTNAFTASQLSATDIYNNRVGRYALLIYQVLLQEKELNTLAKNLFATTKIKLKENQVVENLDSASSEVLNRRTWYRFLYAYCNYVDATSLLNNGHKAEARKYYKIAFDYSPDLTDQNNPSGYFYDMYFLMEKEKRGFQDEYLDYLAGHSIDKNKTLSTLLSIALTNPAYKEKLKSYYEANFKTHGSFVNFWMNSINQNLTNAPAFSLSKTDGTKFSTDVNKGKWILIDFWGTWCAPCRAEHPDLQEFYKYVSTKDIKNFSLLTIACKDTENKVSAYLTKYNYTFPVAMADDRIEKLYDVKSYPSKILITPQGKYLIVPFGVDWIDFIKKYADL